MNLCYRYRFGLIATLNVKIMEETYMMLRLTRHYKIIRLLKDMVGKRTTG